MRKKYLSGDLKIETCWKQFTASSIDVKNHWVLSLYAIHKSPIWVLGNCYLNLHIQHRPASINIKVNMKIYGLSRIHKPA
jgi:hypothetical protein